jgi:LAS superfamily LD-carboxypeptidase LdcB
VRLSAQGVCPNPPPATALAQATPAEGYAGKAIQLRPRALAAYRQMAAAARRADPAIVADPRNLTIFSGFRSPAADAARCAAEKNCGGVVRAACSAHRTGLAMDLYVGQAPGLGPDSSADPNRRFMSQTPAYRWLVANADRFGFVPYPFEPWHWEWTGEAP